MIDWANLNEQELIAAYGGLITELRRRELIRTKNIVGDLGESVVIAHYNNAPDLPRLQRAPANTKSYDAKNEASGERYTIKTTTGTRTSAFHLPPEPVRPGSPAAFDHVIIVVLDAVYGLGLIHEFTWQEFLQVRQWSKTQHAWFMPMSAAVLSKGRRVFTAPSPVISAVLDVTTKKAE